MALWWTKRSFVPSSGVMKPKPLSSLNHLTVPVAMSVTSTALCALRTREEAVKRSAAGAGTAVPDHDDPARTASNSSVRRAEDAEKVAHAAVARIRQRQLRADRVVVAAADAPARHVAGVGE